jgi:hypothetical protein
MGFNLGNNTITPYLGSTPITGVFQGSNKVWPVTLFSTKLGGVAYAQSTMAGLLTGETFTSYTTSSVSGDVFTEFESSTNFGMPYVGAFTSGVTYVIDNGRWTSLGNSSFINNTILTSISFSGLSTMGTNNFSGCTSLSSVSLPSILNTGTSAFQGCTSLTNISLPSATNVNQTCFRNCSLLSTVNLPSASAVQDNAFENCTSLTSINLPRTNFLGNAAFSGCTSLTNVNLSGLSTSSSGLGNTNNNNNVFLNVPFNGTITVPDYYRTNRGGNPDVDLQYLISRGWTVNYI